MFTMVYIFFTERNVEPTANLWEGMGRYPTISKSNLAFLSISTDFCVPENVWADYYYFWIRVATYEENKKYYFYTFINS